MKKHLKIAMVLSLIISAGCYYDIEEELYPDTGTCDVTNVTYSTINGILNNYGCFSCHTGAASSGNINLEGFNNIKIYVNNGKLYGTINHSTGFSPMPQGGNKMSTCDVNKIKSWIDAGALNN